MSDAKFGADLLVEGGRIGGHIIITENEFVWKQVKFGLVGNVQPTEVLLMIWWDILKMERHYI